MRKIGLLALALLAFVGTSEAKDLGDWNRLKKVVQKPVYISIKAAEWVNKDTGKPLDPPSSFLVDGEVMVVFESSAVIKVYGLRGAPLRQYPYSVLGLTFLFGGHLELLNDSKTGEILCALALLDKSNLVAIRTENSRLKRVLTLGIAPKHKLVYKNPDWHFDSQKGGWNILLGNGQAQPLDENRKE